MNLNIDAHHHLWQYTAAEYGWIGEDMQRLRQSFSTADLQAEMEKSGIDRSIAVQARQTLQETDWLLSLARSSDVIAGVVGWVPLSDSSIHSIMVKYSEERKLVGVRHVVQDESDPDFILRPDFNRGVALLKDFGLAYDILVFESQLPQTLMFVERHPGQRFVVDHIAKPRIREGSFASWARYMKRIAEYENVFCKVSGMVTEADLKNWTSEDLKPYFDLVLEAFGPGRIMFGSDWPVCLLATSYQRWVSTVREYCACLSEDEREWVFGKTARTAYGLEDM